jgi:putative SOS response-associated peptidase YedK
VEKGKEPYFIAPADDGIFGFAGLWETWTGPDGGELQSCTILTTDANELMAPVHNRMPLILDEGDWAAWLGKGGEDPPARLSELQHLFRPYDSKRMKLRPVSTYVNNARNEGEKCVEPLD